jgi:predicted nuclease with TOPRIM domain
LDAYIQGTQLPNGEYAHLLICSGDRSTPAGESGCVCAPRIKRLRAEVSRLREALQQREQLWSELNHRYSDLVHNGSPLVDAALDRAKVAEADVSRLQQELEQTKQVLKADCIAFGNAETDTLKEENALLRRSLEMLTKQLDEKDERITELTFTIIRHNSPA